MGGTKKNKAKTKLAKEWGDQLAGVQFSTEAELASLNDAQALKNNYLNNLAKLGWAITNLTTGMKKAYNWHGLDKYRFVPIPSDSDCGKVYRGLNASIREGYTRRNIKRKMTAISRKLKLTKTTSDGTDDTLNESAKDCIDALNGDADVDGITGANLHITRTNLRKNMLEVSAKRNADILIMSSHTSSLDRLINACDKKTKRHSLLSLVKESLGTMEDKWKNYCETWDVKKNAIHTTLEMEDFFKWFCDLTKTKLGPKPAEVSKKCMKLYGLIKCCGQPTHVSAEYGFINGSVESHTLISESDNGTNSGLNKILTSWRCKLRDIYNAALESEKKKPGKDDNNESDKTEKNIWDLGKSYTAGSLTDVLQEYRKRVADTLNNLSKQFGEYLNA